MIERSYTQARAELAELMNRATQSRETILIQRRGHESVALIAADELASLKETAHLLRSPANAARLLSALESALTGSGEAVEVPDLVKRFDL